MKEVLTLWVSQISRKLDHVVLSLLFGPSRQGLRNHEPLYPLGWQDNKRNHSHRIATDEGQRSRTQNSRSVRPARTVNDQGIGTALSEKATTYGVRRMSNVKEAITKNMMENAMKSWVASRLSWTYKPD